MMNLHEDIWNYGAAQQQKLDRHAIAELCKHSRDSLREIVLMTPVAARLIGSAECSTLDELMARAREELTLCSAVFDYIRVSTGVALDESTDVPLLVPIAEQLVASGKATSFAQLCSRLAVVVLAHGAHELS